jgi:hypothetical protein
MPINGESVRISLVQSARLINNNTDNITIGHHARLRETISVHKPIFADDKGGCYLLKMGQLNHAVSKSQE